uniref:DUF1264-domain-containing protein n=1 Tax=Ditylenchus dipsaci TaxID=166011 RepID=A0A915EDK4_9BILA
MSNIPGDATKMASHIMGTGTAMLQSFKPLNKYVSTHLNEDVRQCVIYDSADAGARLIGVEYIISAKLFLQLPEDEKKYWHSHAYEVKSGMLVAPGIPQIAEHIDMEKLVNTYGKTWHLWQVDRGDPLPYGPANLMMSFTQDGQANPNLVAEKM